MGRHGLSGLAIPMGARILALTNDYDAVQIGTLLSKRMTQSEAVAFIMEGRGKRYDPQVVDVFAPMMGAQANSAVAEVSLKSTQLKVGMTLSRDLETPEGIQLLSRDFVLNDEIIEQVHSFERSSGRALTLYVHARKGA